MYQDNRPCDVCGSPVELGTHETLTVHHGDDTIDERRCTNPDCPTNTTSGKGSEQTP